MNPGLSYRETAVRGASGPGLVTLLYEQTIDDLYRAVKAVEQNDIEERTRAINHALQVICHLHRTLDFDTGGEVARNLERFYTILRSKLMEAQFTVSKEILKQQIALLLDLRDAWIEVERATSAGPDGSTSVTPSRPNTAVYESAGEWKA